MKLFQPCFWAGLFLSAAMSHGQAHLSAHDAVTYALSHRPELNSARDRLEESEQLRNQASLKPNPRLILQSEDLRPASPFVFGRNAESYAYLNQDFETAGKRSKRVELAKQPT